AGVLSFAYSAEAQKQNYTIPNDKGSVYANLKDRKLKSDDLKNNLSQWLGLNPDHTYKVINTTTDKLGFTHRNFQQYYQNTLVDGGTILVHSKDGIITSVNGRVAPIAQLSVQSALNSDEAIGTARRTLEVVTLIRQYPASLLITSVPSAHGMEFALAYKVLIDGRTLDGKIKMANVFVNATNGSVIKTVSLIAHADVEATGHTLYSGVRTITTDDTPENGYRLRDNARNIETYNVTGDPMTGVNGTTFDNPQDYFNPTTVWDEKLALTNIQLTEANSVMLSGLGFQT